MQITVFGSFAGLLNMVVFLFMMNFIGALMVRPALLEGEAETNAGSADHAWRHSERQYNHLLANV